MLGKARVIATPHHQPGMMMKRYTIPVAAERWVFILPLAGATAMLFAINWTWSGFLTFVFTLFVLGYPPCPRIRQFKEFIEETAYQIPVVIGTHPNPSNTSKCTGSCSSGTMLEWRKLPATYCEKIGALWKNIIE